MFTGPNIITDGLVLALDAGNTKSYPGSGTTWNDVSGNGNNGTLINGPTFDTGNGGSVVFDGVDDHFTTSTTPTELLGNPSFTISMWVKRLSNEVTNTGLWALEEMLQIKESIHGGRVMLIKLQ